MKGREGRSLRVCQHVSHEGCRIAHVGLLQLGVRMRGQRVGHVATATSQLRSWAQVQCCIGNKAASDPGHQSA